MHAPTSAAVISGGWDAELVSPDSANCLAEKTNSAVAEMAATPASNPSSPSMKFIALVSTTVSSTVSTMPWVWSRLTRLPAGRSAAGQPEHLPLHAEQHHHPGGQDLPGQLGDGVQVEAVVQHTDHADQPARCQHADDLGGGDEAPIPARGVAGPSARRRRTRRRRRPRPSAGSAASARRDPGSASPPRP